MVCLICITVFFCPAYAAGVLEIYSLALENDPEFRAAIQEKRAGDEEEIIGRAGLLPKLSLSWRSSPRNWQAQQYQDRGVFGHVSDVTRKQQYSSHTGSLTLTQPLFDYEAYARYKSGVAQKLMSDERYRGKLQALAVRVVHAYVDASYSREQIILAEAQKKAYEEQLKLNESLMKAGEGTITDVAETRARYSLALAQLIEARDASDEALQELEKITGLSTQLNDLHVLRPGRFMTVQLVPSTFEEWKKIALDNNPLLSALRHSVDAAKYEIERSRAGLMPNIQLYASYSVNDSGNDNTVNQKYQSGSIGFQVSVPLYEGGGTSASVRQAAARYGYAIADMDARVGNIMNNLRKQYNHCVSSGTKITAYELAVRSSMVQIKATQKSVMAGQRVNVDVLNAEHELYEAQRDLVSTKYDYIKSWISLLGDSGVLGINDIKKVGQYFTKHSGLHSEV
ncbi:TolC family outer membrane protein [Salmonella enterica]|nr:TolC family outer membrane protein [Salmonella enterica]ELX2843773.1 TolC family outer membrane protein [Salmonella enterica]